MMYTFAKRFIEVMLALTITIYLTACGGGASEDTTTPPVNKPNSSAPQTPNKPDASSTNSSASSSVIAQPTASSESTSNAFSSYQRSSRSSVNNNQNSSNSDTTPPNKIKLLSYKIATTSLTFIWDHAVDNQGVLEYQLERDGNVIAILEYPTYIHEDKGLTPNTSYSYSIRARDNAGNLAEASNPVAARTLRASTNTPDTSSVASNSSTSDNSSAASATNTSSQSSISGAEQSSSTSSQESSHGAYSSSATKSVRLRWQHPTQRANGDYLELNEIAGYELRKKNKVSEAVIFIVVEGNTQTDYILDDITADDVIDIAVYDTNKLYSAFVPIYPQ